MERMEEGCHPELVRRVKGMIDALFSPGSTANGISSSVQEKILLTYSRQLKAMSAVLTLSKLQATPSESHRLATNYAQNCAEAVERITRKTLIVDWGFLTAPTQPPPQSSPSHSGSGISIAEEKGDKSAEIHRQGEGIAGYRPPRREWQPITPQPASSRRSRFNSKNSGKSSIQNDSKRFGKREQPSANADSSQHSSAYNLERIRRGTASEPPPVITKNSDEKRRRRQRAGNDCSPVRHLHLADASPPSETLSKKQKEGEQKEKYEQGVAGAGGGPYTSTTAQSSSSPFSMTRLTKEHQNILEQLRNEFPEDSPPSYLQESKTFSPLPTQAERAVHGVGSSTKEDASARRFFYSDANVPTTPTPGGRRGGEGGGGGGGTAVATATTPALAGGSIAEEAAILAASSSSSPPPPGPAVIVNSLAETMKITPDSAPNVPFQRSADPLAETMKKHVDLRDVGMDVAEDEQGQQQTEGAAAANGGSSGERKTKEVQGGRRRMMGLADQRQQQPTRRVRANRGVGDDDDDNDDNGNIDGAGLSSFHAAFSNALLSDEDLLLLSSPKVEVTNKTTTTTTTAKKKKNMGGGRGSRFAWMGAQGEGVESGEEEEEKKGGEGTAHATTAKKNHHNEKHGTYAIMGV
eukprot:jgi/Bigna1/79906/fgenesh1_pg.66_\